MAIALDKEVTLAIPHRQNTSGHFAFSDGPIDDFSNSVRKGDFPFRSGSFRTVFRRFGLGEGLWVCSRESDEHQGER
jgi:hypothetical protein